MPDRASTLIHPPLVVVMGVSGSGKSTIGRALAAHYSYCFLEGDDFHSDAARSRMAQGLALDDEMRAPWIAAMCERLKQLSAQHQPCVLAFSGLRAQHRERIRHTGFDVKFLFLTGNTATIQQRLNDRSNHFMAPDLLGSQIDALENPLSEPDVLALDVQGSPIEVAHNAIQALTPWLTGADK